MKVSYQAMLVGAALVSMSAAATAQTEEAATAKTATATVASFKLNDEQLQKLIDQVKGAGFYGLQDQKAAKAVAQLREHAEQSAPLLAKMLTEGLQHRKVGWIMVFRPMYILEGMGPAAKVALPGVLQALDDEHQINVGQAADLLVEMQADPQEAVPALLKALEKAKTQKRSAKRALSRALLKLDPQSAAQAGIEAPAEK